VGISIHEKYIVVKLLVVDQSKHDFEIFDLENKK
jgi:hypothetical protein